MLGINKICLVNMLEDTVYCNARNITSLGGWNKDGSLNTYMRFKNYDQTTNLACQNETDQFAVSNNKAKLTYPVALLEDEERYNINTPSLMETGAHYWSLSPNDFIHYYAILLFVSSGGSLGYTSVGFPNGLRFVVSLNSGTVITEGDGSEDSPFIISE